MKKQGLAAKMRKSWRKTTKEGKRASAKNLVCQEFKVNAPNHTWVSDITKRRMAVSNSNNRSFF